MLTEVEISPRYLIDQLLENHSVEYILQTMADLMYHPQPEDFGKTVSKMFYDGTTGEEV